MRIIGFHHFENKKNENYGYNKYVLFDKKYLNTFILIFSIFSIFSIFIYLIPKQNV